MLPNKRNVRMKWIVAVLIIALAVLSLSGCGKKTGTTASASSTPTATPDNVVQATYKGGEITQGALKKFMNITVMFNSDQAQYVSDPQYQGYLLQQIAVLNVLDSLATDAEKKAAEVQVQQQMAAPKGYTGTDKTNLDTQLKSINVTLPDVEAYLRTTLVAMQHINSQITDQQLQDAYNANVKADPNVYVSGTVDHILIATMDLSDPTGQKTKRTDAEALAIAKDVKSQLDKGGDFAALAKKYSDDTGSSANGGNLGNSLFSVYDPAFKQAALTLPIGQVSDPILISYGYDILKVESRKTETFDDVKSSIQSDLSNKLFSDFVTNDFPAYNYKSNLPTPAPTPAPTMAPLLSIQPSTAPTTTAAPAAPSTTPAS